MSVKVKCRINVGALAVGISHLPVDMRCVRFCLRRCGCALGIQYEYSNKSKICLVDQLCYVYVAQIICCRENALFIRI